MKNRHEKIVFEAKKGITFEVSKGTRGELIIYTVVYRNYNNPNNNYENFQRILLTVRSKYVNIYTVTGQGSKPFAEVVELVYGSSLENCRRLIAYRGFESHPLRQILNNE